MSPARARNDSQVYYYNGKYAVPQQQVYEVHKSCMQPALPLLQSQCRLRVTGQKEEPQVISRYPVPQ
jgi:hypothetical protein